MQKIGIYQHYWGPMGGGQRFVGFIAQILAEQHAVEILHHDPTFDVRRFSEGMELDLSRVAFRCLPRPERPDWNTLNPYRRLKGEIDFCREFSEPYDVFLESGDLPPVFNHAKKGVLLVHFPLVSFGEFHGHDLPQWKNQRFFQRFVKNQYQRLEWRCRFSSYQRYLCNSQFTRRWCQRRWGISPQILNPPLRGSIRPMEKQPMILALGAFAHVNHKRQDILIETFRRFYDRFGSQLEKEGMSWKFRLVGACKDVEEDRRFVEKLQQQAAGYPVEFLLNASGEELLESLGTAVSLWHAMGYGVDELQNPGKTEHFGMIATESMAAATIPMVYHAGGLPEIIHHGRDGFLWSTPEELIQQTHDVLGNPARLQEMQHAAVENAQSYGDAAFRQRLREVLKGIVD
ncbi:MAG: glycosyltransferase family 4 protein [Planctomycetia bacterium]|nr:glycosyltransferase family 4 protein [Planctomycetia bacterium]